MDTTASPNIWVVRHGDGWAVRRAGSSRIIARYRTQREAIDAGKRKAKMEETELIWQGRDGRIRGRNSYGTDPFPPRG